MTQTSVTPRPQLHRPAHRGHAGHPPRGQARPACAAAMAAGVATALALAAGAALANPAHEASQQMLPEAVRVPAGHRLHLHTVGEGQITYECRAKKDMADQHDWAFVGPDAALKDSQGRVLGRYYGPPATWAAQDGSQVTGTQVAVAPAAAGNIPLQLVKANPASGQGQMQGVTYIQRLATKGGVAPAKACAAGNTGERQTVNYRADYLLWRAA